jgi:hypothetical protein
LVRDDGALTYVTARGFDGLEAVGLIAADGGRSLFVIRAYRPANRAPVLSAVDNQEITEGEELVVDLQATDADGDQVEFGILGLAGAAVSEGALRWLALPGTAGSHQVLVRARDGSGGQTTINFNLTVNEAEPPAPEVEAAIADSVTSPADSTLEDTAIAAAVDTTTHVTLPDSTLEDATIAAVADTTAHVALPDSALADTATTAVEDTTTSVVLADTAAADTATTAVEDTTTSVVLADKATADTATTAVEDTTVSVAVVDSAAAEVTASTAEETSVNTSLVYSTLADVTTMAIDDTTESAPVAVSGPEALQASGTTDVSDETVAIDTTPEAPESVVEDTIALVVVPANNDTASTIVPEADPLTIEPQVTLSAESLDFGEIEAGSTASLWLSVANPSDASIDLGGVVLSGNTFTLVRPERVVPAHGRVWLEVLFRPETEGVVLAYLALTDVPGTPRVELLGRLPRAGA